MQTENHMVKNKLLKSATSKIHVGNPAVLSGPSASLSGAIPCKSIGSAIIMVLMSLLVFAPPALPASKTLALVSRGAKANYQMEFLRLHKGAGTDSLAGGNDAIQHLYLGNDIDDDFFGVRFFEADGTTPIAHRRMICQTGKYADFIIKLNLPDAGQTKNVVLDYAATGRATESSDAALENICFYGWVRQGAKRNGWVHDQWGVENTTLVDSG
ncbi:MAG: hypothetical protein NTW21_35880, partial [Verrucomicrobia bacterium]|nr:hypothetical protein [Verrucomicrobiota bacterium]